MLASSKPIHCFSPLSRKLDVGWPRIEDFQLRGHSCVNNVQRCLCHFYTWMRHSKQTATLLLTKRHANFDTSTSAKGYARVCMNCACAIVVLGILLAQARPTMPCIRLVNTFFTGNIATEISKTNSEIFSTAMFTRSMYMYQLIGASLSEPHIDGTAGRFHICIIIIIIIIVRPSPARRAWSHEVCRASHSHTWLP